MICYYLFYPAHEESLRGCTDFNGNLLDSARDFGSFAGEWHCIAVLLDRANVAQPYVPKWAGLTNRNTDQINLGTGEVRATMRILPWSAMLLYEITHPQFNVAIGSHALYVNGESLPVISFSDPTAVNCGAAAPITVPGDDPDGTSGFVVLKAELGLVVAGPFGALAGLIWGLAESPIGRQISLATPELTFPDDVSNTGFVIYPKGKPPPGVQPGDPSRSAEWKSDPVDIGDRHYDFTVDRATQPFWGEDPAGHGFTGRWGPRVEGDTIRRRAGMSFPKFWQLFFSSLVRADPPSRSILLMADSGPTWTVPADWNSANNSIECIGGGGGGGGGNLAGLRAGGGGGGGEYRKETNVALTPGAAIAVSFGAGGIGGVAGTDGVAGGDTVFNAGTVVAKGGGGGGTSGAAGTAGVGGAGSGFNSGGAGGSATGGPSTNGGAGGGGAGGPLGTGGAGGSDQDANGSGAGGGGNGGGSAGGASLGLGGSASGSDGGNNSEGVGGGKGGEATPGAPVAGKNGGGGGGGPFVTPGLSFGGAKGGDGIDLDSAHGSGGGGGGGGSNQADSGTAGGAGGNYGGGGGGGSQAGGAGAGAGGDGADGIIVIRYTPAF